MNHEIIQGIPNFLLALPYMALTKIILEHFNETEAVATLFSSEVYDKPEVFKQKYYGKKYSLKRLLEKEE